MKKKKNNSIIRTLSIMDAKKKANCFLRQSLCSHFYL